MPKKPQAQKAGRTLTWGKPGLRLPEQGAGKAEGMGACAPRWWVFWEPRRALPVSLPGELVVGGSGQGPAGSLAGSWGTGPVLGRQGPGWLGRPRLSAPPELCWSLICTCSEGRPLASTPGTSPELMEPETSNHSIQLATLPRLHELSPTWPAPQNM